MFDPSELDALARRIAASAPPGLKALQEDFERNTRSLLQAGLAQMNLVTREEFDVQKAVLLRTRERLEALEQRIAELEQQPPD